MKMSSVWLHWNYTWGGDVEVSKFSYQSMTYKSRYGSTPVELARRTGSSGILSKSSSISDSIGARIDVISHNSTLVVHNLQYNDSGSNFSSFARIEAQGGRAYYSVDLYPVVVTLDVTGECFS